MPTDRVVERVRDCYLGDVVEHAEYGVLRFCWIQYPGSTRPNKPERKFFRRYADRKYGDELFALGQDEPVKLYHEEEEEDGPFET